MTGKEVLTGQLDLPETKVGTEPGVGTGHVMRRTVTQKEEVGPGLAAQACTRGPGNVDSALSGGRLCLGELAVSGVR